MPKRDGTGPLGRGCGRRNQSNQSNPRSGKCLDVQIDDSGNMRRCLNQRNGLGNGAGNGFCFGRKQRGNCETRNY